MECTRRCVTILAYFLVLLSIVQETSQDKKVRYLLGRPAENCTSACASRGMPCIEVGAFPSNALSIFYSINMTCTTPDGTNWYKYKDNPNYCISGGWRGRCMGFKIPNATSHLTLCGRGGNPTIRRLCPCTEHISTTLSPTTTPATTTSSTTTTTTLPSPIPEVTPTTAVPPLATKTRDQYTGDKTELISTWLIAVIAVAVVLVICGLSLVLFVTKKRKKKDNSPARIRSAPEQANKDMMDGSDNIVYMESMVDMNSPSKSLPTDNILYESSGSPYEPECELNELYGSCEDENQHSIMMTTTNPIYEESVEEKQRHESRGVDNTAGFDDEYASIDLI